MMKHEDWNYSHRCIIYLNTDNLSDNKSQTLSVWCRVLAVRLHLFYLSWCSKRFLSINSRQVRSAHGLFYCDLVPRENMQKDSHSGGFAVRPESWALHHQSLKQWGTPCNKVSVNPDMCSLWNEQIKPQPQMEKWVSWKTSNVTARAPAAMQPSGSKQAAFAGDPSP